MDRNLLLAVALSFAVLTLWSMYQEGNRPPRPPQAERSIERDAEPTEVAELPSLPTSPRRAETPPLEAGGAVAEEPAAPEIPSEKFAIEKSLYRAELDTRGGVLRHWRLREYRDGKSGDPVELTTGVPPYDAVLATPFEELGLGNLSHRVFEVEAVDGDTYHMRYRADGIEVSKTLVFHDDSYTFDLLLEVENESERVVAPRFAVSWPAHLNPRPDYAEQALVAFEDGSMRSQPVNGLGSGGLVGSLLGRRPAEIYDYPGEIDWAGIQTTYFLAALMPEAPGPAQARFVTLERGQAGVVQLFFDEVQLSPGRSASRQLRGYVGPKEPARLEAVGASTPRSIYLGYSWVTPLTRFFAWFLHALHSIIPNYGVAIILLTVLVRVVTTPLTFKQMRSMERMRALQPMLKEIQEKYADDRQKQSEQMMALYRREKVNPLGGCLPMILQLPVFIGLFYALRSSIDLRQAPFFGWIDDLSTPETLFVIPGVDIPVRLLPLIMGATMVVQQRITPMQVDPAQARMMMTVMPIVMTVVFYQFASGLVLYWMVSNVLAIGHQLWIGRRMRKPE